MSVEIVSPKYSAFVAAPGVDVTAHVPFLFNGKLVIPQTTVTNASGAQVAMAYRADCVRVPKATGEAWTPGDKLYWDDTAKKFTKTATSNTISGRAVGGLNRASTAASADTEGLMDLDPAQA